MDGFRNREAERLNCYGGEAKPNAETLAAMKELEDGGANTSIHSMNYGLVWRNRNVKSKRFWTVQEGLF